MTTPDDLAARWRPHVEAWESSGQSPAVYCREYELVKSRFTDCKNKLRPSEPESLNRPGHGFVPVQVINAMIARLKLQLPNGVSIEVIRADKLSAAQQLASTWL